MLFLGLVINLNKNEPNKTYLSAEVSTIHVAALV